MRKDPSGRALQLLSLLQTHRLWRGAELAERLGRYPNRRYRALAEELGLEVAETPPIGWSGTT